MNYKVLRSYTLLCEEYGWEPTWDGLKAYHQQVKTQMRQKWA